MSKFVHNIKDAVVALEEQIQELQAKADSIIAAPKKLEEYPKLNDKKYQWRIWQNNGWGCWNFTAENFFTNNSSYYRTTPFTQEYIDKVLTAFDKCTEEYLSDCVEIRSRNKEVITHNKLQVERLRGIMKTLGVSERYSTWEYKRSNSRNKTEAKHNAGWLSDVSRTIQEVDCYDNILRQIKSKREQVENYGKKLLKEQQEKERVLAKEEQEKTKVLELATLCAKYTPEISVPNVDSILENMLNKNRYLTLAYYLECNRGDWSDGYHYADIGLSGFECMTDGSALDKVIIADIQEEIDDWDSDGRCFRDCEYNYSVLYGMVEDKVLLSDLETLQKYINY